MILTDREIEIALANKTIIIEPSPAQKAISSTTLDLTLASGLDEWVAIKGTTISPGATDYSFRALKPLTRRILTPHTLKPQTFVLAWTIEEVSLPLHSRIAARVEGKSSLARLGVGIHVTAPTIHSGFSGNIQLEVFNHGPLDVVLTEGMYICQLVFEQTYGTPKKGYDGMFAGQKAPG